MPGQHSDEERERKERIKKLKAKTSKMRLAVVKKKSIGILPRKGGGISELSERVTNRRIKKDYAKGTFKAIPISKITRQKQHKILYEKTPLLEVKGFEKTYIKRNWLGNNQEFKALHSLVSK